jgi:putative (di)nucleoside polyphosphate hydrolase
MAGAPPPGLMLSGDGPHPGYRPCVGLMLINSADLLFIGQRRGPVLDAWQMPQGGIDPDETPHDAAWRELREEVGTDHAHLVAESRCWYAYDLPRELWPPRWGDQYRGQSQKWFAFRFTGADEDIDIAAHEPEFVRWRWARADDVLHLVVAFKRPVYQAVLDEFGALLAA